jgi:hypothetical protein
MRYKKYFFLSFLACTSALSKAQETISDVIRDSLVLNTKEKHTELLEAYINYNKAKGDYRIQIVSGSLATANETLKNLDKLFSGWPNSIDFESPSFRLRIGNFKTRLEAERMLIAVRKKYKNAVLLKPQHIQKDQ